MRRRTFLASSAALLSAPAVASRSAAHQPFTPLGYVGVENTYDAVVDGETAYVAARTGFAAVDVSDPADPTVLAERRDLLEDVEGGPLTGIWDVAVADETLVAAGPANGSNDLNGLGIFDVSDPANPERTGIFRTDYPIHNLDLADGFAYLTGNDGDRNPMVAVDIEVGADVGSWSLLDHDEAWGDVPMQFRTLHDIWAQDGRAYLAHWDAGTWIVDVSDPAAMTAVAQVRGRSPSELAEADGPEYIRLPGNDHYVTTNEDATLLGVGEEAWTLPGGDPEGGPGGIELYDISTPTEAERLARIEPPATDDATYAGEWTTAHNFDLVGDRLYSSWYRGGVRVHDVSDPAAPAELAAWADRDTAEFFTAKAVAGRPFFVASSTQGGSAGRQVNSGLYTFPAVDENGDPQYDHHGSPAGGDQTTTTTRSHDSCADHPTCTTPYGEATDTATATTERAVTPPEETTTPGDLTTAPPTTEEGDGPGFGVVATALGLLGGGWYARRRGVEGEE
jgi:hypothetical protein